MNEEIKRLFFAYEIMCPWPESYPKARLIDFASRHVTLAFLGNIPFLHLQKILPEFPPPPFKIVPVGNFDDCLFLPERHPRVVAWHLKIEQEDSLSAYQNTIAKWLSGHGYLMEKRPFLAHVSIGRNPLNCKQWKKEFVPLPFMINSIHLYESKGNLIYQPIWSYPLVPAFEEKDHTADIAFLIQAESMPSLHLHAQMALAFKQPALLQYIPNIPLKDRLDDIIISLNRLISQADSELGCSLKAVSFHGGISEENGIYKWEMIVDV